MKKVGLLFIVMIAFLMVPFSVLADKAEGNSNDNSAQSGEENSTNNTEEKEKAKIYFFRGEGCPHCAQAEEFFNSIKEEYGHLYEIIDYEVYKSADNSKLMDKIAEMRGDNEDRGIPYIIIGNKSWAGYTSGFNNEIIDAIKAEYEKPVSDRYDIMDLVGDDEKSDEKTYGNDAMVLIIILIVVAGSVAGVMFARKKTA